MIEHLLQFTLPAAYSLLPLRMHSPEATAMLIAIALQESDATHRKQFSGGPALGFWGFERGTAATRGGVTGIMLHGASHPHLVKAMTALQYRPTTPVADAVRICHAAVEHNDTLAAVCARLLLWTLPVPLPTRDDAMGAWEQYLDAWNPGAAKKDPKPHMKRWLENYPRAWSLVEPEP